MTQLIVQVRSRTEYAKVSSIEGYRMTINSPWLRYLVITIGILLQVLALILNAKTVLDFIMIGLSIVFVAFGLRFPSVAAVLVSVWFIAAVAIAQTLEQGSGFYLSLVSIGFLITRRPPYVGIILGAVSAFAVYYGHSSIASLSGKFGMVLYLIPLLVGFGFNQLRAQKEAQEATQRLRISVLRENLANQLHDNLSNKLVQLILLSRLLPKAKDSESDSIGVKIREVSVSALSQLRDFTEDLGRDATGEEVVRGKGFKSLPQTLEHIKNQLQSVGFIPECTLSGYEIQPLQTVEILTELVEEIATNIMKHGQPNTKAYILVRCTATQIRIFSANQVREDALFTPSGLGLKSMKSKVNQLGGQLETRLDSGQYSISISVPKS